MQLEGSSSVCPTTGLPSCVTDHAVIPPSKNFILWLILLPSYSPEHCTSINQFHHLPVNVQLSILQW
ncbi:hypothetical protein PCASD_20843 [Puccinia coronata f. sp. avenae]|uniref:Uncharacterized protein n=1 Tax=Puccinia coronata f. sp. avenae TaxID=200324 RepID=A0A2N5TYB6_9BASI|nr:hypothetical protein PCASD_20843 [Puccinia coronata f. sp. avenae]